MKLKTILLLTGITAAGVQAQPANQVETGQPDNSTPQFAINLKYNAEGNRYEVYAKANFTSNRFILGPSQISLAVPKQVADQPLDIYSETARWTDYSSVYAPAAAPDVDFHGVNSMGKVIDFREGEPFMLFFFSLKGGYTEGVRLFVNGKDPNSAQKAMMGGDFSNTIQDYRGKDFFRSAFNQAELAQLTEEVAEPGAPEVAVYPNPIRGDNFSVTAKNFNTGERVKLRLLSTTGVELYAVDEDAAKLVNFRMRVPNQLSGQAYLVGERTESLPGQKTFCKKLIITN